MSVAARPSLRPPRVSRRVMDAGCRSLEVALASWVADIPPATRDAIAATITPEAGEEHEQPRGDRV